MKSALLLVLAACVSLVTSTAHAASGAEIELLLKSPLVRRVLTKMVPGHNLARVLIGRKISTEADWNAFEKALSNPGRNPGARTNLFSDDFAQTFVQRMQRLEQRFRWERYRITDLETLGENPTELDAPIGQMTDDQLKIAEILALEEVSITVNTIQHNAARIESITFLAPPRLTPYARTAEQFMVRMGRI